MVSPPKYYQLYEARYRRVYQQGVPYWSGAPAEVEFVVGEVDRFTAHYRLDPHTTRFVEMGCGEGYLAAHLAQRGYAYLGIDLAPSALAKAQARTRQLQPPPEFVLADVTKLPQLQSASFQASLDNFCLHMLVTDADRCAYLRELVRVLQPGAPAFFRQLCAQGRPLRQIPDFQTWCLKTGYNPELLEEREAYVNGQNRHIKLPRVPARTNSPDGYVQELAAAGFSVDELRRVEHECVLFVRRA